MFKGTIQCLIQEFVFANKEKFVNAGFVCKSCESKPKEKNSCHATKTVATFFTVTAGAVGYTHEEIVEYLEKHNGDTSEEHKTNAEAFLQAGIERKEKLERQTKTN